MIVLRDGLVPPKVAGEHPVEKFLEPIFRLLLILRRPRSGPGQQPDGIDDTRQRACLDKSLAPALVHAANGLSVLQVWNHAGRRIKEPVPDQDRRTAGILFIAGKIVGQRQRFHCVDHLAQVQAVSQLVDFRIPLAVTANIGQAVRRRWIRPPVWRQAHVVALVPARRNRVLVNDREWPDGECAIRLLDQLGHRRRKTFVARFALVAGLEPVATRRAKRLSAQQP